MLSALRIRNLTVTRKLALGFGLLLLLALLLALIGEHGLRSSGKSLQRISQVSTLFDETVFTREANYNYALKAEPEYLSAHDEHQKNLSDALDGLLNDIQEKRWPAQDLAAVERLRANFGDYIRERARADTGENLLAANERLLALQESINELYYAEEERAAAQVSDIRILLTAITLLAMLSGAMVALVISRQIVNPLRRAVDAAQRIADGDLTVQLHSQRSDELGMLLRSINNMSLSLRDVIAQIGSGSHQLAASASQLASITNQTQAGIDSQRSETDMVATAMNEMSATVQEVAQNSEQAASAAQEADHEAENALQLSQQAIQQIEVLARDVGVSAESMAKLRQESERIGGVLDVIKTVAGQTNLLALNAAIEAARAGEAGRGFAVVADEVRNLAQRTQNSSEEIEKLIAGLQEIAGESSRMMQTSVDQTHLSVNGVRDTGAALAAITRQVSNIQQMSALIATAAEEQSAVAEEINRSVSTVRDTAEESASASAEISSASNELARLGNDLERLVGHFRT
ncbi:methyl-accepting chemotaxis protein [Stutzerimonas kirkiae]|uniref:Methyl-accepting chemotaxis protein n=1 Tax=Stutzerimonas kirkiae TaxID=2211392 RepID=A0A4Q9QXV3_9GAMM|nr:methyl-accepting chemotaxis protein [Stutzerimonas kirkiae]TBU89791.1 methyl-accepting chemotaxis protein [Stutzerimonas kirkiae]TBU99627.1 methyl-accepting chemotaxis protein [Stutzerimonas kirkiae]TBV12087.1 methyl-accepting chemotaxis protein [Stutzerimonas kirkiae]TBV14903.1 methyl-accepting chemotaxis protein [Stutzerimonas kirkiae]